MEGELRSSKEGVKDDEGIPKESVGLLAFKEREDEEAFLVGRRSKEGGSREVGTKGDSTISGDRSFAFRFTLRTFSAGGGRTVASSLPSLLGVPIFGKVHFFLFRAQD